MSGKSRSWLPRQKASLAEKTSEDLRPDWADSATCPIGRGQSRTNPGTSEVEELLRRARDGKAAPLGQLLEMYQNYLALLARLQIGRRLQGKVDDADLVQ